MGFSSPRDSYLITTSWWTRRRSPQSCSLAFHRPHSDSAFGLLFDPARSATRDLNVVSCERMIRLEQGDAYRCFIHTSGEKSWRASKETIICNDRRIFSKALSVFFDGREPRHRGLPRGGGTGVQHGSAAGRDLDARRRQLLQRLAGGSRRLHERRGFRRWRDIRLGDRRKRWEVGVAAAHGIPNDWWMVPVFYDGDRCVFFAWHRLRVHFGLQVYRVKEQTAGWDGKNDTLDELLQTICSLHQAYVGLALPNQWREELVRYFIIKKSQNFIY